MFQEYESAPVEDLTRLQDDGNPNFGDTAEDPPVSREQRERAAILDEHSLPLQRLSLVPTAAASMRGALALRD